MSMGMCACGSRARRMFVHLAAPPCMAMDRSRCALVMMIVIMMILGVRMLMTMTVVGVAVLIDAASVRIRRRVAADKERTTESRHQQSRRHSEPWVELLRDDPLGGIERDDAERVDRNRVRRGYDGTEQQRMAGGAA